MQSDPVDSLVSKAMARAQALRRFPESTYRIQLHSKFTFSDATAIIPYLSTLGVTHIYTSPLLKAVPGSTHGYDVVDHCQLNPEFGTDADYQTFVETLARHGMSHILDTVPNHVGVATNESVWWNDMLEHGPASAFATYFDIAWQDSPRPELHDRILIPILGDAYAKTLENGELRLSVDASAGSFAVDYWQRRFPVNPSTYGMILSPGLPRLLKQLGSESSIGVELQSILHAAAQLPPSSERDEKQVEIRRIESISIKRRIAALTGANVIVREHIDRNVQQLNGAKGEPRSFDALDALLTRQSYRLAFWQTAPDEINYRRFFDVNDLAALTMERPEVFERAHALTLGLLAAGKLSGLRIDHPDGLYDPQEYFKRLQSHFLLACAWAEWASQQQGASGPEWDELRPQLLSRFRASLDAGESLPLYVVAEKILTGDERLPRDWAIHGTSGYHFLNMINGLFVDSENRAAFDSLYTSVTGDAVPFDEQVYQKKKLILDLSLASELQMLTHRLERLARKSRESRDFTYKILHGTLAETIACFPVYRTYITDDSVSDIDAHRINTAIDRAIGRQSTLSPDAFEFLRGVLLQHYPHHFTDSDRAEQVTFAGKFQQLTSPVTAKGVEDTTFYCYTRLLSLNEVGGEPSRFGMEPDELHNYLTARQKAWPYGLSTLSTHDTKRSEDVRARINVLSQMPCEWKEQVAHWSELNRRFVTVGVDKLSPSANEQYVIYQTLLGAWPLNHEEEPGFVKRVQAYMIKAMREAKVNTTWTAPNADHESAVERFIAAICDPRQAGAFLDSFKIFEQKITRLGLVNSLAQTMLRLTCPGAPDTYQGTELWDLSMVDPDNRRPVDYAKRREALESLQAMLSAARENHIEICNQLVREMRDGRAKLWLTWNALRLRRDHPGLFTLGTYRPAPAVGEHARHLFAFSRQHDSHAAIVAVPRLLDNTTCDWADTELKLPAELVGRRFRNVLSGETFTGEFRADKLFRHFPVALLIA